ncbi:hypothetical protein BKA62DRAFT_724396 [Auriculariales sp. MPI-PUGE-AT-0066]|nr:hypothetical protein BKA62DRAFT_724396 [Auriculariales sp. MPI-PUGE-AT-0066]
MQHLNADVSGAHSRATLESLARPLLTLIASIMDLFDRLRLSCVSRTIHNALVNEPSLWSRMHLHLATFPTHSVDEKHALEGACRLLDRAQSSGIQLTVSTHPDVVAQLLLSKMAAVQDLRLSLQTSDISFNANNEMATADWRAVSRSLTNAGPVLVSLRLTLDAFFHRGWRRVPCDLPRDLLDSTPGRLRKLSLRDVAINAAFDYPALSHLTTLSYSAYTRHRTMPFKETELNFILRSMPQLQRLALCFGEFEANDSDAEQVPKQHLTEVVIGAFRSGISLLVELFKDVPNVKVIRDSGIDQELHTLWSEGDMAVTLSPQTCMIVTRQTSSSTYTLQARSPTQPFGPSSDPLALAVHASRVTSLALHEFQWETVCSFPVLPKLVDLTIIVGTCYDQHFVFDGGLFSADPAPSAIFPALETFTIYSGVEWWYRSKDANRCRHLRAMRLDTVFGACCCRNGWTVDIGHVVDFVHSLLEEPRRMKRIVIGGIDCVVDPFPAASLAELQRMAEDVEFISCPPKHVIEECRRTFNVSPLFTVDYFPERDESGIDYVLPRWPDPTIPW